MGAVTKSLQVPRHATCEALLAWPLMASAVKLVGAPRRCQLVSVRLSLPSWHRKNLCLHGPQKHRWCLRWHLPWLYLCPNSWRPRMRPRQTISAGRMCLSANHVALAVALVAEDIVRAPKQVIAFIVGQVLRGHQCATCVALSAWLMMACPVSCVGSHLRVRLCD